MTQLQKRGRTLGLTISELMDSVRLRIAVDNFHNDPVFMKAILTELGLATQQVTKNCLIRFYSKHSAMNSGELAKYMRNFDEFNTYETFWGLSDAEKELYLGDIKGNLSEPERKLLFEKVRKRFIKTE